MNTRMILTALAFASALVLASTPGHALTFNFSYTCIISIGTPFCGNVSGTVTGVIEGLQDNSTGPATAISITSLPSIYGAPPSSVPTTSQTVAINTFTVSNGVITSSHFSNVEFDCPPDGIHCELDLVSSGFSFFSQTPTTGDLIFSTGGPVTYSLVTSPTPG